jgi:hypothetical protein
MAEFVTTRAAGGGNPENGPDRSEPSPLPLPPGIWPEEAGHPGRLLPIQAEIASCRSVMNSPRGMNALQPGQSLPHRQLRGVLRGTAKTGR